MRIVVAISMITLWATQARADDYDPLAGIAPYTDTAHVVGICVAAEVGPDLPKSWPDYELRIKEQITQLWAIHNWWSIRKRKKPELTLAQHTRAYCQIFKHTPKGREWILRLPDAGGAEPERFPKSLRWKNYRPRWEALLARVRMWLGPCEGPEQIEHWNVPDSEPVGRMQRAQCDALFADKGRTRFYVVPR